MTATALSIPTTPLADGTAFPLIGFGTSGMKGVEGARAISEALRAGYRLIDSAAQYGNEAALGQGLRDSGVDQIGRAHV